MTSMRKTLQAVGTQSSTLDMITGIVKTCRQCRAWMSPGSATVSSITLPERFNQHVECDLMFYKAFIIFHMIYRCARWHAAKIVQTKFEDELLNALFTVWTSVHGPPEFFYIDGESGLNTDEARAHIKRQGSTFRLRAPQQHARFIERRGAVLRVSMHTAEGQCVQEGLQISTNMVLALSVFAGNALTTVGTGTPYQAVYGRQPLMLPPLEGEAIHTGDSNEGRVEARAREITIS